MSKELVSQIKNINKSVGVWIIFDKSAYFYDSEFRKDNILYGDLMYNYEERKGMFNGKYETLCDVTSGEKVEVIVVEGEYWNYYVPVAEVPNIKHNDIKPSDNHDDSNEIIEDIDGTIEDIDGIIEFDKYIYFIGPIDYGEGGLDGSFRYGCEKKKGRFYGEYNTIRDYITGDEISVKVINGIDNMNYYIPTDDNNRNDNAY